MENKFTPGKWHPVQYGGFWNIQTSPYYEERVNILDADDVGIEQSEANAKLIAAAPELLEALQVALWDLENGEAKAQKQGKPRLAERAKIYRNAINKATE